MKNAAIKKRNIQRINDAAIKLFFKKGIDATTVNEIAQLARVSKVSIYKHFNSKLDIALSIADNLFHEFKTSVSDTVFGEQYDKLTGFEQVKRIVENYTRLQDDDPIYYIFLVDLNIFLLRHRDEVDAPITTDRFSEILKPRFVSALEKGRRDKTIGVISTSYEEIYEMVSATFRGIYLSFFSSNIELSSETKAILRQRLETVAASILKLLQVTSL